jgi:hypothetical protein
MGICRSKYKINKCIIKDDEYLRVFYVCNLWNNVEIKEKLLRLKEPIVHIYIDNIINVIKKNNFNDNKIISLLIKLSNEKFNDEHYNLVEIKNANINVCSDNYYVYIIIKV